jgi:hypothetical protein
MVKQGVAALAEQPFAQSLAVACAIMPFIFA